MTADLLAPATSLLAEQLVGLNTKVQELQAQRVTYVAGTVTALDHVNNTFTADVLQPDATSISVAGIRSAAQFLPAIGNVVTLALSGPQLIYIPYGVAAASIDTPQLSTTVTNNINNAVTAATGATAAANAALYSGQNLAPDPSFENGFLTTFTVPFSLDLTGTNAHTGIKAVKAVANASAANLVLTPAPVPILQGHTYRLSAWRKTDAAYNGTSTNGKLKLVKQDGTTAVAAAVWTQGTSYAQVQTTYTVPSDGSVAQVQLVVGTDHSAGTLWVDDVELADITDANAAQTAAASKIITFIQTSAPTASEVGDLWINTSSNQTMYRWNGVAWVQVQDQQIQSALTNAANAQSTADTKIVTFIQATAPTASETGDLWMDTSNGNKLFRWNGATWVSVQDAAITTALTNAAAAQTTANTKVLVFAQAAAPIASEVGDIWFDTDDGMKMRIWGPTPTVTRVNQALNPSFEADAAGTVTSVSSWTNYTSGSVGTVTRSIVTTGGVTNGTKAAKSSSSSQAATAGVGHGYRQAYVAAQSDIWRVQATFQLATTGANFVPYILVEFLDSANTVLAGSVSTSGSGTSTGNQLLSVTTAAAPANTASVRVTLQRRTAATTGTALATCDITIDSVLVERNRDAAAPTTYFDGSTAATAADSKWDNPVAAPNSTSTIWQSGVAGVNGWQLQQFRTGALADGGINGGAIATQSILGHDAIAYGSITAPLLEALLVLAGTIVAGSVNADHAALMTDGLHLYRVLLGEGLTEVGTLAVGSFGTLMMWVDNTGKTVALVDEGGAANFTDLNVDNDPLFQGTPLSQLIAQANGGGGPGTLYPGARNHYGWADGSIFGITAETGIIEIATTVQSDRMYMVVPSLYYQRSSDATYLQMNVRDGGSSPPTLTSPVITTDYFMGGPGGAYTLLAERFRLWQPTTTGTHRLLVTADAGGDPAGHVDITNTVLPTLTVLDLGPSYGNPASVNRGGAGGSGGASAPPPTQQYYVDLAPAGYTSYRGSGTVRTDTTDVVQGWDPSGFNGLGVGLWWFNLPSITGTVNRVDWYVYTNHTYYNTGGTAVWNIVSSGAGYSGGNISNKQGSGGDQYIAGYPKPGPKVWTLPSSWWAQFKNTPPTGLRAIGVSAGNSTLGTNEHYYCRFDGPSARLRIWYTQ